MNKILWNPWLLLKELIAQYKIWIKIKLFFRIRTMNRDAKYNPIKKASQSILGFSESFHHNTTSENSNNLLKLFFIFVNKNLFRYISCKRSTN